MDYLPRILRLKREEYSMKWIIRMMLGLLFPIGISSCAKEGQLPRGNGSSSVSPDDGRPPVPRNDVGSSVSNGGGKPSAPRGDSGSSVSFGDGKPSVPGAENLPLSSSELDELRNFDDKMLSQLSTDDAAKAISMSQHFAWLALFPIASNLPRGRWMGSKRSSLTKKG